MTLAFGLTAIVLVASWFVLADRDGAGAAERMARSVGLRLDDAVRAPVEGRLGARRWWSSLGMGLGALVGAAVAWVENAQGVPSESRFGGFVVLGGVVLGRALGTLVALWRERAVDLDPTAPRIARAQTPGVADYVSPVERWGAWTAAAAAAALAVAVALLVEVEVFGVGRPPAVLLGLTALLPAAAMAGFEVVAARVVRRGQLARSPLELAWDDVLRASLLRELVLAALSVAFAMAVLLVAVAAERTPGGWPENPGVGLINGLFLGVMGAGALLALVSLVQRPDRHVMRRLWDEVPA